MADRSSAARRRPPQGQRQGQAQAQSQGQRQPQGQGQSQSKAQGSISGSRSTSSSKKIAAPPNKNKPPNAPAANTAVADARKKNVETNSNSNSIGKKSPSIGTSSAGKSVGSTKRSSSPNSKNIAKPLPPKSAGAGGVKGRGSKASGSVGSRSKSSLGKNKNVSNTNANRGAKRVTRPSLGAGAKRNSTFVPPGGVGQRKPTFVPPKGGGSTGGGGDAENVLAKTVSPSGKKNRTLYRGKVAYPVKIPWILRFFGSNTFTTFLETLMAICSYAFFFVVTYEAIFSYESQDVYYMVFAFDLFFLIDLFARLCIEMWRHWTKCPCTFFLIPMSLGWYLLELWTLLPLDFVFLYAYLTNFQEGGGGNSIDNLNYVDYFRANKFFKIFRLWAFYSLLDRERKLSEFLVFLLKFFTLYLVFIQVVACLFYYLAQTDPIDHMLSRNQEKQRGTWFDTANKIKPGFIPSPINHYIMTLSYAVSLVTTVGYGDIAPRNEKEMLWAIFIMLIGAIGMAGLFSSNVTSFQLERDGARFDLFYRVKSIQKVLKRLSSSALFAAKVREYYECLWNFREGVFKVKFIDYLPTSMHEDIFFDICTEMFHKAILFRGLDEAFLRAVCKVVEVVLYNPDMIICQQGGYAMTMYYIIQGECVVKSRQTNNVETAILRAGCIFGESSLFFSFPYSVNVETKTCCQLLRLNKESLMEVFNDHIYILNFMRSRIQERMTELRLFYEELGQPPITWVQFKTKEPELESLMPYADYPTDLRWVYGCNRHVHEDIVDDTEAAIIVDMPCLDKKFAKNNTTVYRTCVVPPTLLSSHAWVHWWHFYVMAVVLIVTFLQPYNFAFECTTEVSYFTVKAMKFASVPVFITFIIDLFIEITTACPVSGIHYKFKDGFKVKKQEISFYVDVFAAVPFEVMLLVSDPGFNQSVVIGIQVVTMLSEIAKLWKILRYLRYLDDVFPQNLFWFRLIETTIFLLYLIHFLTCLTFKMACPYRGICTDDDPDNHTTLDRRCGNQTWINSWFLRYLIEDDRLDYDFSGNTLANRFAYLVSSYFATATITSAGFGDFSPQNVGEMTMLSVAQIIGFWYIGYSTALLTSALSCNTRPKVFFQQKLVSIRQFLQIHGLSESLRDRIIEHYSLQHQYYEGVVLPADTYHLLYDSPSYLEEDYLFTEVEIHLEGIPIFTKVDPKLIIKMSKLMERYILPPNIYFIRRGDVRRQMYVIFRGSVALLKEDTSEVKSILEATGHFGLRDLLYGEPSYNNIKTLSYCLIYAIDLEGYQEVFEKDTDLLEEVKKKSDEEREKVAVLMEIYASLGVQSIIKERKPDPIPSWIVFPNQDEYSDFCEFDEFMEPYEKLRYGGLLRVLLMRRTVHPAGTFALIWNLLCGLVASVIIISLVIECGVQLISEKSRVLTMCCHGVFIMDLYLKMHWGYYTDNNHLISHPIKTASHFLFEGPLIYNFFCGIAPFELTLVFLDAVSFMMVGEGLAWVGKLRWVNLMHLIRMPIILEFGHDVFTLRTIVLLILYVGMTMAMCTCVASYALYVACPWGANKWKEENAELLPACLEGTWISKKHHLKELLSHYSVRWIVGIYYVAQTTLVIGYGDLIVLNEDDLLLLNVMMIFGFIVLRCIISDMTAAAVDSDEIRSQFSEQIKCLQVVMLRGNVKRKFISNTIEHMKHTWLLSRGLQPKAMLNDLHPALQSDLFREYIGDTLAKVPIFSGVTVNTMRTVCQYLGKLYFSRGERIMRLGNLEYEMYIIVDGDVWIHEAGEIKCTLGPGESMGETQMMFGLPRRYSATASNNVEVFVLTSEDFSHILERYPLLEQTMKGKLSNSDRDLFERKIAFIADRRLQLKASDQKEFDQIVQRHTNELLQLRATREDEEEANESGVAVKRNAFWSFCQTNLIGWGPDDFDLPFLYFASPQELKQSKAKFYFLIHPKCAFQRCFEFVVLFVCMVSPALGLYQVFFAVQDDSPYNSKAYNVTVNLTWAMEGIMMLHIFLQFFTPFPTVEGKYCKEYKRIAFRYVANLTRFWFDLIATFPAQVFHEANIYRPLRHLNLIRILRLWHYYRTQKSKENSITITTFQFKLSISVPTFGLMAHGLACLFYEFSKCNLDDVGTTDTTDDPNPLLIHICEEGTWTRAYLMNYFEDGTTITRKDIPKYKWYVRSLYWVVTTISTTGYGDIVAESIHEIIMAIICVFCGAFVLSVILSHFTAGITSRTKVYREYIYQVKLLAKYLTNIGLNSDREDQVLTWFLMLWDACRGTSYRSTTGVLPTCLQIDVNLRIYQTCLRQVSLFKGLSDGFLRQVANRLNHTIYLAGLNVVNEGDKGGSMFIVANGKIAGYRLNSKGQPTLIRWYNQGDSFGRLPTLFYDQTYTKSYRAEETSEILWMVQKDVYHLAQHYPDFARNLQAHIKRNYNPELGTATIFSAQSEKRKGVMEMEKLDPKKKKLKENKQTSTVMRKGGVTFDPNKAKRGRDIRRKPLKARTGTGTRPPSQMRDRARRRDGRRSPGGQAGRRGAPSGPPRNTSSLRNQRSAGRGGRR